MPSAPQTIPVWVEMIVNLEVVPDLDEAGAPDWSLTDPTPAAQAAFPDADIVTACTVDRVDAVMNEEAAALRTTLDEVRRMLNVVHGAITSGFSTKGETENAIANIIGMLPTPDDRPVETAARVGS